MSQTTSIQFTSQRNPRSARRPVIPADHGTKRERLARERLLKDFHVLDSEDRFLDYIKARVPDAWRTLERDVDVVEPKVRLTLRVDESVAKFYRAMGNGYQERMNRVLSAFAQLRISQSQELAEQIEDARLELRQRRLARVEAARRENGGKITKRMLHAVGMSYKHLPEDANGDVQHLLSEAEREEFWSRMAG